MQDKKCVIFTIEFCLIINLSILTIMKTINFCFRVHQRYNLKQYRFFEIGNDHYYYDDYEDEMSVTSAANQIYLEANNVLLNMIKDFNGRFKVSFIISGLALDQLEKFAPEVIDSFKALAKTDNVEFIATPYAHSLASLYDDDEFARQLKLQSDKIYDLFGKRPSTLANTSLIYSDEIAAKVAKLGYKNIIIEETKHVMGWKSPHYIYHSAVNPKIKLLVRDNKLSDDINFRFSQGSWHEYPLTADKFMSWIANSPKEEEVYNICMGYEALGKLNVKSSGIFDFFRKLPEYAIENNITFSTPSKTVETFKSIDALSAVYPISWTDEEKDVSAWCGNELQNEALSKLYSLSERVNLCNDLSIKMDWQCLQDSYHFFFMTTKHYSNGRIFAQQVPYDTPYDAFINYMNVLSDFIERVKSQFPTNIEDEELNSLLKTINYQNARIEELERKLKNKTKKV